MASKIAAVIARFPERELEIHRQYARDPKFEEICEDYGDALVALRHWEGAGPAGATRAEDYRRILEELEAEILGILDGPHGCRPRHDEG
jgi:hypothetical protein